MKPLEKYNGNNRSSCYDIVIGGKMPYDPRPVSEGGNSGIDDTFSRKAPEGKYRVIGVDTFDGTDWVEDDFDSLNKAEMHAFRRGDTMLRMYVYDDKGICRYQAGTF